MVEGRTFPSVEWFERLAASMGEHEAEFRDLGPIDCTMVVKVTEVAGDLFYEIRFEAFEVRSIRQLDRIEDARPTHFVLDASVDVWEDMLENIQVNGAPDLEHTLNYLTFPDDPMLVSGPNQLEIDAFYRYNGSLQKFFNGSVDVPTIFSWTLRNGRPIPSAPG